MVGIKSVCWRDPWVRVRGLSEEPDRGVEMPVCEPEAPYMLAVRRGEMRALEK